MKKIFTTIVLSFFFSFLHYSQITTTITPPANCVQNLVGPGVQYSNVLTFGSNLNSFATFTGGTSVGLGFNSGVYLTSGNINSQANLNNPPSTLISHANGAPGDPTLNSLGAGTTFNATVLQFDFVPTGDTIKFRYIFASEEYNFYVNSGFNDVFAFFLTGPNPSGPAYVNTNIALIPTTTIPVTINNLNNGQASGCASGPCEYCQYYVDNLCANGNFAYNGYTVALTAIAPVVPCQTYTIKLAVADVGDQILDSGVFLEEGSFVSNIIQSSSNINFGGVDTLMFEGCSQATITIVRTPALTNDTIIFNYGGNASMGIDYNMLPDTLIFSPGNDTLFLVVNTISDNFQEMNEFLSITINAGICSNYVPISTVNLYIIDVDSLTLNAVPDSSICAGEQLTLNMQASGGTIFNQYLWIVPGVGNIANDTAIVTPIQSGYYYAAATDICLQIVRLDSVFVTVFPSPQIVTNPNELCSGVSAAIGDPNGNTNLNWVWSPATNLNNPNIPNPIFNANYIGTDSLIFIYNVAVDSAGVVCASDSVMIILYPNPQPNVTPDSMEVCFPLSVSLDAGTGYAAYQWSNGVTSQTQNVTTSGWYIATVTDGNNCQGRDSAYVVIYPRLTFTLNDVNICTNVSTNIGFNTNQNQFNIVWTPNDYLNNGNISNPLFQQSNPGPNPVTYTYVVTSDSAGFVCYSDTMNVTVYPIPSFSLPNDTVYFCENSNVTIDAGSGYASYLWSNGFLTQSITVSDTGWFTVTVTSNILCSNIDSSYVIKIYLPNFNIPDITICEGDTAILTTPSWQGSFLWNTGSTDTLLLVTQTGTYTLTITNSCGTGTDTIQVIEKPNANITQLPNVFSPNGDGMNDEYYIADLQFAEEFTILIYNRWGRLLFETSDASIVWKGEGDGNSEATLGVYFAVLKYKNCYGEEKTLNGNIHLFR
ncbi:MAG: choice-of-anchor L domain-containing protein [Flavobacteriales bacterium]|nr:choice-of-anchor L domain-containing protein [Flavobacteriales bacterium]